MGPQSYTDGIYSDETETIVLHEHLLSRSSVNTTIKTIRDQKICHIKAISHRQRLFTSVNGQADLFILRPKSSSVSDYQGKSFTGHDFTIHTHFKIIGARSTVSFQNAADSKQYDLTVEGDWLDDIVRIRHGQQLIAEITKAPLYDVQSDANEPSVRMSVIGLVDICHIF